MRCKIELTKMAIKDLNKVPLRVTLKLQAWIDAVDRIGIHEIRKLPGFHDEPLKGDRKGQRSIRLSLSYRAIYIETEDKEIHLISILEVNKHDH